MKYVLPTIVALLFIAQVATGAFFYTKYQKMQTNYWTLQQEYVDIQNEKEELDYLQSDVILEQAAKYNADMEIIEEAFYEVADIVDNHADLIDNHTARIGDLERRVNLIVNYLR